MGYNHYWHREPTIAREAWDAITAAFERTLLPLDTMGVRLAGPLGDHLPEITSEQVAFNGLQACGHVSNEEVWIPFPASGAAGIGDSRTAVTGSYHGFGVLLKHRACNSDCSFETFSFARVLPEAEAERRWIAEYCKTGFRPYNLAIQCFLLIAKHHGQHNLELFSGGADEHWSDARRVCYLHLGYPLLEFRLDGACGVVSDNQSHGRAPLEAGKLDRAAGGAADRRAGGKGSAAAARCTLAGHAAGRSAARAGRGRAV